ncbi:hypothetical protein KSE_07340 [Kitasatospora setae KM-6054]|uniref:Uncharacterized protein n=1 Tax=Kitasatospora setae (strain ATCC 33774 / DSM 43861 / JCM 3304 / KCC A-0304 / NBRC 14216 / KM-6054) TaxID=452652 RepID=E4N5U3_KITSK|nr:hypothetical protein KSE_07340 [Kitasatospora setae KM-6054]
MNGTDGTPDVNDVRAGGTNAAGTGSDGRARRGGSRFRRLGYRARTAVWAALCAVCAVLGSGLGGLPGTATADDWR